MLIKNSGGGANLEEEVFIWVSSIWVKDEVAYASYKISKLKKIVGNLKKVSFY